MQVLVNKISSREKFSLEDTNFLQRQLDNIVAYKDNKVIPRKQAIEIIEFLYFVQKIEIKCDTFLYRMGNMSSNMKLLSLESVPSLDFTLMQDSELYDYINNRLSSFLLDDCKAYDEAYKYIYESKKNIPKKILNYVINDYIYAQYIYNSVSFAGRFIQIASTRSFKYDEQVIDIVDDIRWKRVIDKSLLEQLVQSVKNTVSVNKGSVDVSCVFSMYSILFSIGIEIFRLDNLATNIDILDQLKNDITEVIRLV